MTEDIFNLLKNNPTQIFTAREISEKVEINLQSAHRSLRKLVKMDCIRSYKLKNRSKRCYWYENIEGVGT